MEPRRLPRGRALPGRARGTHGRAPRAAHPGDAARTARCPQPSAEPSAASSTLDTTVSRLATGALIGVPSAAVPELAIEMVIETEMYGVVGVRYFELEQGQQLQPAW